MTDDGLRVSSGALIAHRLLDVAFAIDLKRAETLWLSREGRESRRTKLATASANELAFEVPPTLLVLPPTALEIAGQSTRAEVTARLYDFGVIAIALRVDISDLPWSAFSDRFNALDRTVGSASGTDIWRRLLSDVLDVIGSALYRPSAENLEEDYLFAIVNCFQGAMTGKEVQSRANLAALLSGETRPLSEQESAELTQQAFSYFVDDLVVLTWDRAFLYEPRRDSDVAGIIEVANAQLLELRYYDELLDDELPTMYDLVESTRSGLSVLASRRAARLARKLYSLVAEVTELTEKVENALQVTEDVYLARVYSASLELFRVSKLSAAVDRKLAIIRDTYSALYEEASSRRAELMELAIVLLIVFEIGLALFRR
jgi:hypothetical protein